MKTTTDEVNAAIQDKDHWLRKGYRAYKESCRRLGMDSLTFFGWIREYVDEP